MCTTGFERIDPKTEYRTLREELLQSRRYVFERPLLIAALGTAALHDLTSEALIILPPLISSLLVFNFWFTINRLLSSARIAAYIQVALEDGTCGPWIGWETSLRRYRMWHKDNLKEKQRWVDSQVKREGVPDALMYYPPIYQIHIALILAATVGSIVEMLIRQDCVSLACTTLTIVLFLAFGRSCLKWRPSRVRPLVERNRIIWCHVLRADAT